MKARTPLVLSALIPVSLVLGFISPLSLPSMAIVIGIGIATLITVGGLSQGWHSDTGNYASASRLFFVNILAGSVPLVGIGLIFGSDTPIGLGFLILAAMPVAAGIPAYAATLGVRADRITLFTLISYAVALLLTPIATSLLLGDSGSRSALTATIVLGLIVPTILGLILARPIARVPISGRRSVTIASLLIAIFGVGTQLGDGFSSAPSASVTLLVVTLAILRAPLSAGLAVLLNKIRWLRTEANEAALAGGYRNCALAAIIALAAGIPEAAIPGALGLASEALLLFGIAAISKRQERVKRRERL